MNFFNRIKQKIDIRDFLYLGGIVLIFYGLHLVAPWVAFAVTGLLAMLTGYLMRDKEQ